MFKGISKWVAIIVKKVIENAEIKYDAKTKDIKFNFKKEF